MWWWDERKKRPAARRRRRPRRRTYTSAVDGVRGEVSPRPSARKGKRRKGSARASWRPSPAGLSGARWLSLGLLLGVCILGWQLLSRPEFRVEQIEVSGNRLLSSQHISEATGLRGTNIYYVNTHEVEERLKQLSLVRDARVSVHLPNRVHVEVEERRPAVTWVAGDTRVGVDEEGMILPPQAIDPQAPVIEVMEAEGALEQAVDTRAIAVAQALHELRPDLRSFVLSPQRGIAIVTEGGWPVYFGWETQGLPVQLELLDRALPMLRQEGDSVEYVDLRYPAAPYYHRRQGGGR